MGPHVDDERVMAWDLCNEPFTYGNLGHEVVKQLVAGEKEWLADLHRTAKALSPRKPAFALVTA